MKVKQVSIEDILPPANPIRTKADEDKIVELANSIETHGLLQPLVVKEENGKYRIIAGHRRYIALKAAGVKKVPVSIVDVSEEEALSLTLEENLKREDVDPMDEARFFKFLLEEKGMTQERIAQMIGKDRSYVAKRVSLLSLPSDLLSYLEEGSITPSIALILRRIDDDDLRAYYASLVASNGATQRVVESWVKEYEARKEGEEEVTVSPSNPTFTPTSSSLPTINCFFCGVSHEEEVIESLPTCVKCKNRFKIELGSD